MELDLNFFAALLSIVIIDLVLAGDNAVVIAMAVKNLRGPTRTWGIALGSSGAVLVRVISTFLVAQLLALSFVKLIGGAVILWIAVKLLVEGSKEEKHVSAGSFWQALWLIIVADMSMGIDNMLAVGAACGGSLALLLFGLGLSIPFVVFMSSLLAKLMDRFPLIIYIGAAILGKVGGEMMITDPIVQNWLEPGKPAEYGVMAFFTIAVVVAGKWLLARKRNAAEATAAPALTGQPSSPIANEV
jgi:YjbE family integral membrane protein